MSKKLIVKVQNLSNIQQEIVFTEFDFYQQYVETFKTGELGRIKSQLLIREIVISFRLIKSGDSRENIPNRIVNLSKPHIITIVRGKETKMVEFGAKGNNILIDGISFIEKLSFNAFNEGTRLMHCVSFSEKLTGVPVKKIGADQG